MNRVIWKYSLEEPGFTTGIQLFAGAKFVRFGSQNDGLFVWFEHHTSYQQQHREFLVVGTGRGIPDGATHLGSIELDDEVWHLYELKVATHEAS